MPRVFQQLYNALKPGGRLLVRDTPKELLRHAQWYRFFPEAHEFAERRYSTLAEILKCLVDAGFQLRKADLWTDSEQLEGVEELIGRYKTMAFSWCRVYLTQKDVFAQRLADMRTELGDGAVQYEHSIYLLVLQKPG
jgi:hypothetical protein